MFGSNSYLGLNDHPEVKNASAQAISVFGTGTGGSRLLNGSTTLHEALEERLADFVGQEAAIVFASGYQANVGALTALLHRHDTVLHDAHNHASLLDGSRLGLARSSHFRHLDMADLDACLQQSKPPQGDAIQLVVTDTVFSMEGDVAPIDAMVALTRAHQASLMVDEAHALGVLGEQGRGAAYGLDPDVVMGTFSKSLASIGGFIAADRDIIDLVKHQARSLVFSAALSPSNTAAALCALDIMQREPDRQTRLHHNARVAERALIATGLWPDSPRVLPVPILPIRVRDESIAFALTTKLLEHGVFVNPVIPPAVPAGTALLRFSVMATHDEGDIVNAIEMIAEIHHDMVRWAPQEANH